ncbi:MAG: thiopurine S-methyltransferase [Woeseiaceae bacterium]|nr:thiopurine S-methyltransferase [Woeseiaceae bacterium]
MTKSWLERWRTGRIGWHEERGNRSLRRHWRGSGRRVLVPMCGKSVDLLWLAGEGNSVTGVELSEIAVNDFFEENQLHFRQTDGDRRYEAIDIPVSIVCGDYFEFDEKGFDAHYDRGALVALPAGLRGAYAAHTSALLVPDREQLVITLEYDQDVADGPPFSVAGDEVESYWPGLVQVDAYDDIENCPPKFRDAGLEKMLEVVWKSS